MGYLAGTVLMVTRCGPGTLYLQCFICTVSASPCRQGDGSPEMANLDGSRI